MALWPIVGREQELQALVRAMEDPACGGVALVGSAGVGKTRLATRASELAAERGMTTVSVRATRSGSEIPFAALAPFFDQLGLPTEIDAGLFRSAAAAVDERRGDHRFVLVVDDAQDLDDASSSLLDQLVDRGGTFVVLTVRLGERDAEAVLGMWKDEQILRIDVGLLADEALRTIATMAVGGPLDGATQQAIIAASAGNVLFLRELVLGAVESGALTCDLGLWRLSGSLAHSPRLVDLIQQRLAGLSEQEIEALELVALGDPVELSLLSRLVPLEAVEHLEARGLLDAPIGDSGAELRLNHPLYGEIVRAKMPSLRRARLCRALADAAEVDGEITGRDVLRVAVWRLDGGGEGRPETIVAAARAAFRSEDFELSVRLAETAWEEWGLVEAALILGDALDYSGRCREAEQLLEVAFDKATTDRQRTSVVVRRAAALFRSLAEGEKADEALEQASGSVTDHACRRELDAVRGNHLLLAGEVARAISLDEVLLGEPGDAAFAQASLDVGTALALAGRTTEAIEQTTAGLETRRDLDDEAQLSAIGVFLVAQALAFLHAGRLGEAEGLSEAGYKVAVERLNSHGQAWFASVLGLVRLAQGRLSSATNLFREVASLFGSFNHPGRAWGLGGAALAAGQMGDPETASVALDELDAMAPTAVHLMDVGIARGRAWSAVAAGELSSARTTLWGAVALAEQWGQLAAASEALHDLVRLGDRSEAPARLEELAGEVDGSFMEARVLYGRAAATGDPSLAAEAADRFETVGATLFAAEATSLERELAAGQGLARRAAAAGTRTRRLLGACEGVRTPALGRPGPGVHLSVREHEVALLAAQDLTSRQIADRLVLSVRTIDNHLQRVYMKLGLSSRAELADHLQATSH